MATTFWECGFEAGDWGYYEAMGWYRANTGTIISNSVVHTSLSGSGGSYALFSEDTTRSPLIGVGGRWMHFWMSPTNFNSVSLVFLRNSNTAATIYFYGNGSLRLVAGAVDLYGAFNPSLAYWVTIEAVLKNTGGTVTIKLNGRTAITVSGADTTSRTEDDWDQFQFGLTDHRRYIDDMIITTDDELSYEHFIEAIVPNGNNTTPELTATSGNNYDVAAQMPVIAQTPYNYATAVNQEDNYDYTTIGWTPDAIPFIGVWGYATRDGSITQAELKCNGVLYGTADSLPAAGAWEPFTRFWDGDPADADAAWTKAKIDSINAGIEFK